MLLLAMGDAGALDRRAVASGVFCGLSSSSARGRAVGGWSFFVRGWESIVHKSPNMFTLIALGTATAFGFSVYAILFPIRCRMRCATAACRPSTSKRGGDHHARPSGRSRAPARTRRRARSCAARHGAEDARRVNPMEPSDIPLAHVHVGDQLRVRPG